MYTDEDSLDENLLDLSLDDDPNMVLFQRIQGMDDIPDIDVSFELREKRRKDKELEVNRKRDFERHLRGKAG